MDGKSLESQTQEIEAKLMSSDPKNYAEALNKCDELISANPMNHTLQYWKAKACMKVGNLPEALKFVELAAQHETYAKEAISMKQVILAKMKEETKTGIEAMVIESSGPGIVCNGAKIDPVELQFFSDYLKWLIKKGATMNKIAISYFTPSYRGIETQAPITKDEVIVYVPKELIISCEMAKRARIGSMLLEKGVDMIYPMNSFLSTFILDESLSPLTSPWTKLIAAFPKSVDNFPIFFTPAELALLEGSHFIKDINDLKNDMQIDYDRICAAVPEFKRHSLNDFMRTRSLVNSRIFGTTIDGKEDDSIVPYADMCNCKLGSDMTNWAYNNERQGFEIRANEDINKSSEIYVFYGNKPNTKFFLFYGFVVENNPNDKMTLMLKLHSKDPLKAMKAKFVEYETTPRKLHVEIDTEGNRFTKLISYLRYVEYEEKNLTDANVYLENLRKECKKEDEKKQYKVQKLPFINIANEVKAMQNLSRICIKTMKKYPTTYEQDLKLLSDTKLDYNQRNCIILRSSEKKILQFYIDLSKHAFDILINKNATSFNKDKVDPKMLNYLEELITLVQGQKK